MTLPDMRSLGVLSMVLAMAMCACGPGDGEHTYRGSSVTDTVFSASEEMVSGPRDTLITDTVITDEGYMLLKHRLFWLSAIDSVDILIDGRRIRSQMLNEGSYMAARTSLKWTNERFVCFYFGCGSPCWGKQYIDLKDGTPMREILFPIWSDSTRSLVVYPDTANPCCGLILEDLKDEQRVFATVDTTKTISLALSFDSAWVQGEVLHLRRSDRANKVEQMDLRQLQ